MRYADFDDTPAGRLVPTVYGERAFVPDPLPPNLDLGAIALDLAGATGAMGELRGACRRLPDPWMLIRPLQRLEAQTSSAMEGTYTTADDLALAEAGIGAGDGDDTQEAANYIRALKWALSELDRMPLSNRIFKGAHARLMENVGKARGENKRPGEFKRDQNMVGGRKIATARFIPPPPREAEDAMADLERFLNREDKSASSPLLDMALAHYQFETIHPFGDGNGRLGRMLISLMAITEGLLDMPALYMSPELEGRKEEYIERMYAVSARSEWREWIVFFLDVLTESCRRTTATIDRILALQADYRRRAEAASRSQNIVQVVDMLFERPVIRPAEIVEKVGVTDAAARNLLRRLTELDILVELRVVYPTAWLAPEIIRISTPENA